MTPRSLLDVELGALLNGDRARPVVTIDFDSSTFVSSYYDQALETLCGEAWRGEFGDPLEAMPTPIREAFGSDV